MEEIMDELGKIIKIELPNGIIFFTAWVDAKLNPASLEVVIADDGISVEERMVKPDPKNGKELVSMYNLAGDKNNIVVQHLDAVLRKLKKGITASNIWITKILLELDEEVIGEFVDIDGNPTNHIAFKTDDDGSQRICFFLKTIRAHAVPSSWHLCQLI
jgi:hypothetical protein